MPPLARLLRASVVEHVLIEVDPLVVDFVVLLLLCGMSCSENVSPLYRYISQIFPFSACKSFVCLERNSAPGCC